MPKRSKEDMAARREEILQAARICFARKGFQATTIADICAESSISAGGIYTHFANKHAIAQAIGGRATEQPPHGEAPSLLLQYDALRTKAGLQDAQLDLNMWSEALHDEALATMVGKSMDDYRAYLRRALPADRRSAGWVAIFEALALGLEVQRALGRSQSPGVRVVLTELLDEDA